jgi:hypothetical protein
MLIAHNEIYYKRGLSGSHDLPTNNNPTSLRVGTNLYAVKLLPNLIKHLSKK